MLQNFILNEKLDSGEAIGIVTAQSFGESFNTDGFEYIPYGRCC